MLAEGSGKSAMVERRRNLADSAEAPAICRLANNSGLARADGVTDRNLIRFAKFDLRCYARNWDGGWRHRLMRSTTSAARA